MRQTGSVTDYMAAHKVLAAKTTLPMQLRIHWWEQGPKPEIASQVTMDPLTHTNKAYTDTEKALDARFNSSRAAAARKRDRPAPCLACANTEPKAQHAPKAFNGCLDW